ncbi:hypothetical protein ACFFMN_34055 [Planobispora siamensis]|uniref:Uncharacterized protein n=1 Tax=Planobispora siamensis TaxID=936338 RepID=A0A8J3WKU1_9ACTN|nr:hypothetical protein [Planobispora siamensis]GIH91922.1 hypothetical protein Psi01_25520 [Planobispora siamensis]
MADYDFPTDLIALQHAYWQADAEVQRVTDALPPSTDILGGSVSDEQWSELARVRTARMEALEALDRHSWWSEVGDRYAARQSLRKAAREALAGAAS